VKRPRTSKEPTGTRSPSLKKRVKRPVTSREAEDWDSPEAAGPPPTLEVRVPAKEAGPAGPPEEPVAEAPAASDEPTGDRGRPASPFVPKGAAHLPTITPSVDELIPLEGSEMAGGEGPPAGVDEAERPRLVGDAGMEPAPAADDAVAGGTGDIAPPQPEKAPQGAPETPLSEEEITESLTDFDALMKKLERYIGDDD